MSIELHKLVLADLAARKNGWEEKQRLWYEMRHDGLPRQNMPFPGASDLHFPLIDSQVEKLKPFFAAQIWGNDTLATFVSLQAEQAQAATVAAWFDYKLRQKTNWFEESQCAIDHMVLGGKAIIKVRWNTAKKALEFDAIDPLFVVVPPQTKDIQTADRVTHILQLSVEAYKADSRFNQDAEVIARIKGKGAGGEGTTKEDTKYSREGITHGHDAEQIVLWETYVRKDGAIIVETTAPTAPDVEVRAPFKLVEPYSEIPLFELHFEIKDKGYYSARGVAERVAAHEAYLTRLWNEKADAMTFLNRPIFTHEGPANSNLNQFRLIPGQIAPNNLRKVDMGSVPFDFDQEMANTRTLAEYQVAMPDFGLGRQGNQKDSRTAAEINAMTGLMAQTTDQRAVIFRRCVARIYTLAWHLLRAFDREELDFYQRESDARGVVTPEALAATYQLEVSGSVDNWNRQARQQRALARLETYGKNPFCNLAELFKHVLEEDDPRLVRRLFQDPQMRTAEQGEDQAQEITILREGYPARVLPADDDAVHLDIVLAKLELILQHNIPETPTALKMYQDHAAAHLQQMQQRKDPRLPQYLQRAQAIGQALLARSQQQAAAVPAVQPAAPQPEGIL